MSGRKISNPAPPTMDKPTPPPSPPRARFPYAEDRSKSPDTVREFYTVREAAAWTGLPEKTLYQFISERRFEYVSFKIPGARKGKILIPIAALRKFIDAGRVAPR